MASAATAVPPLPPDVTQQQGPPVSQFAEGAMKKGPGIGGPDSQKNSMEYVKGLFKQIGELLTQAMQVISVEKPPMVPLIVRMAGVGAAIEKQLTSEAQGQGQKQPSAGASGPEPEHGQAPAPESQEALGM